MSTLSSLRVVYKVVDGQEIDADVYIPDPKRHISKPVPVCRWISSQVVSPSLIFDARSDQYPWRGFYAGLIQDGEP